MLSNYWQCIDKIEKMVPTKSNNALVTVHQAHVIRLWALVWVLHFISLHYITLRLRFSYRISVSNRSVFFSQLWTAPNIAIHLSIYLFIYLCICWENIVQGLWASNEKKSFNVRQHIRFRYFGKYYITNHNQWLLIENILFGIEQIHFSNRKKNKIGIAQSILNTLLFCRQKDIEFSTNSEIWSIKWGK